MSLIRDLRSRFLRSSAAKTRTTRPLRAIEWQFQHSQGRNVHTVTFNLMPMDVPSPYVVARQALLSISGARTACNLGCLSAESTPTNLHRPAKERGIVRPRDEDGSVRCERWSTLTRLTDKTRTMRLETRNRTQIRFGIHTKSVKICVNPCPKKICQPIRVNDTKSTENDKFSVPLVR